MSATLSNLDYAKEGLRRALRPFVPTAIRKRRQENKELQRRQKFDRVRTSVSAAIMAIHDLPLEKCSDIGFLETKFIPSLGLNDELLHERPKEFSDYFGSGLHIWQYPNQLARYLAWISTNCRDINCYAEIGCRWGGTFILISEWLQKQGNNLRDLICIDLVDQTPFIDEYFSFLRDEMDAGRRNVRALYLKDYSTAPSVKAVFRQYFSRFCLY